MDGRGRSRNSAQIVFGLAGPLLVDPREYGYLRMGCGGAVLPA